MFPRIFGETDNLCHLSNPLSCRLTSARAFSGALKSEALTGTTVMRAYHVASAARQGLRMVVTRRDFCSLSLALAPPIGLGFGRDQPSPPDLHFARAFSELSLIEICGPALRVAHAKLFDSESALVVHDRLRKMLAASYLVLRTRVVTTKETPQIGESYGVKNVRGGDADLSSSA
jgi:hypothetical protein